MERLTEHSKQTSHENGICCTHFRGPECLEVGGNCAMNCKWEEAAWSRLAAYEDTRLEPEEIDMDHEAAEQLRHLCRNCDIDRLEELAEADKACRLVVLPCRIGATAYILIQDSAIFYPETNGWYIVEETIDAITQDGFYLGTAEDGDFRPNDAIGKTVFLTREEAEKALEAMKDG